MGQNNTTVPLPPQVQQLPQTAAPVANYQPDPGVEGLLKALQGGSQNLGAQIQQTEQQAFTPHETLGAGTTPGLMLTPVKPYQPSGYVDPRGYVGAKNVRNANIANVVAGAANIVGNLVQQHQQEKNRSLAVDLQRVMESTQGIQQAQEVIQNAQAELQQNPNNQQAKAALQEAQATLGKNKGIINALLQDNSRRKAIAKALDMNFADPTQNKGPEHEAAKQAISSYADQLMKQTPSQLQFNPLAMQKLQMLIQQQKNQGDLVKAILPSVIKSQASQQTETNKEKFDWAKSYQESNAKFMASQITAQEHLKATLAAAKTKVDAMMAIAKYKANKAFALADHKFQMAQKYSKYQNLTLPSKVKLWTGISASAHNASVGLQQAYFQTKELRDAAVKQNASKQTIDNLNNALNEQEKQMQKTNMLMKEASDHIQTLVDQQNLGASDNGTGSSNTSTSSNTTVKTSSTTKTPVVGPTDDSSHVSTDSDNY